MNAQPLSELTALSYNQRSSLRKGKHHYTLVRVCISGEFILFTGNILTVPDLLILSSQDIAKRCRISHSEAQEIVNTVFDELEPPPLIHLDTPDIPQDDVITTGDHTLDEALGGGVRTRKLWEVTGERYVLYLGRTEELHNAITTAQQAKHNSQCSLRYVCNSHPAWEAFRALLVSSRLPGHCLPIVWSK